MVELTLTRSYPRPPAFTYEWAHEETEQHGDLHMAARTALQPRNIETWINTVSALAQVDLDPLKEQMRTIRNTTLGVFVILSDPGTAS